jgi:FixJ family two-component response regulator
VTASSMIVVIDDDASLGTALASLMRSFGYEANVFGCAEDFLTSGIGPRADCIITDIQMPGMNGIDLKQHLATIGCTAPVIMITGRADPALLARAEASGAACVLRKPFEAEQLMTCVAGAIGSRAN